MPATRSVSVARSERMSGCRVAFGVANFDHAAQPAAMVTAVVMSASTAGMPVAVMAPPATDTVSCASAAKGTIAPPTTATKAIASRL